AAPCLRPAHEETLFAGEAVDDRRRPAGERQLPRLMRDRQAAEIADVLAQCELAVHLQAGQRAVLIELIDEQLSPLLELRLVSGLPPVAEFSVAVEPPPLVVEAVADLVADDRA